MKKTLLGLTGFFIFTTLSAITPGLEEYIEVTSTPKGAVISVSKDGGKTYHKIGKTPLKALIKLESLVRLEMEGYKTAEKQISGDIFVSGKLEIKLKWDEEKEKQRKEEEKKALEAEAKKKAEEEAARKAEEEAKKLKTVGHYRINGDGTVTDTKTGLLWQEKDGGTMNWEDAKGYCKNLKLGGQEWRLPSISELQTLSIGCEKGRKGDGYCDTYKGPGEKGLYWQKGVWDYQGNKYDWFWSSSPSSYANGAWVVYFNSGNAGTNAIANYFQVRCVAGRL